MKLKTYKVYPPLINERKQLEEAIEDFGCNICKGSKRLKNDKELVIKAIEKDPTTALYLDEKLKSDKDIQQALERKDSDYMEFVDPISELAKSKNPDELNLLVQARNKILFSSVETETTKSETKTNGYTRNRNRGRDDQELGG